MPPALAKYSARSTHAGSSRSVVSAPGPLGTLPAQGLRRNGQENLQRKVPKKPSRMLQPNKLLPPGLHGHPFEHKCPSSGPRHRDPDHMQVKPLPSPSAPIAQTRTQPTLLSPGHRNGTSKTPATSSRPSCPSTCPVSQPCSQPRTSCQNDQTQLTHIKRESRPTTNCSSSHKNASLSNRGSRATPPSVTC